MRLRRLSRAKMLGLSTHVLAGAALAGLPIKASASNQIVTYPDGAGIVSPAGVQLLRIAFSATARTITLTTLTTRWTAPASLAPGQSFSPSPGVVVSVSRPSPNLIKATMQSPGGPGWSTCDIDPAATNRPVYAYLQGNGTHYICQMPWPVQQCAIITCTVDAAQCAVAVAGLLGATITLVAALLACGAAPEAAPADIWAVAAAFGAWCSAVQNYDQLCNPSS